MRVSNRLQFPQFALAGWLGLSLLGCSGGSSVETSVGGVALPLEASGDVAVEFLLVDPESTPRDVALFASLDRGVTWMAATIRSGAVDGLVTSPQGVLHELVWDAIADLGSRAGTEEAADVMLSVRITNPEVGTEPASAESTTSIRNLATAADRVEGYMIYFGALDAAKIAVAETHDLVILYPCDVDVTREAIAEIQDGVDAQDPVDDVIVLGYLNVGEDDRTIGIGDTALLSDPRFTGDGTGPRVDPRGPGAAGGSLEGLDPLGLPSNATGYASWYLDDASIESNGIGDGKPDRNGYTGACVVNAGDPAWFATLDAMTCDSADGIAGIREMLTTSYGRGYGFDGIYLDNIDTCAPNTFTGPGDPDQAEFEWTAPGFASFIERLSVEYPNSLIMQNRGLFFFNPDHEHFGFTTREHIDFLKFEEYRLDADPSREFVQGWFEDNKYNLAPRLQSEANRRDGFQVLSLGYAEGPGIDSDTLSGTSTSGMTTLLADITEAQNLAGFRHYLTDGAGALVNSFVRDRADFTDTSPPVWNSVYNANTSPLAAAMPRVGIQQVIAGVKAATVRWDVALDLHPVHYVLYYDDDDFDFSDSDPFEDATVVQLDPEFGLAYDTGASPTVFPYQATITGLKKNKDHWFCIRAVDAAGNEENNQVVLMVRTLDEDIAMAVDDDFDDWDDLPKLLKDKKVKAASQGPDWKEIKVVNDATHLYVFVKSHDEFTVGEEMRIFIDVDADPFTGVAHGSVGAELDVRGLELYASRTGAFLRVLTGLPTTSTKEFELSIPLAELDAVVGTLATDIRMSFRSEDVDDDAPDSGHLDFTIAR